ncbi:chondroitinase-B domain-containing protein [Pedobacter cryotolerans]|uniref:Right handed beta helix domain-containing protein n=1 Tax=Pedobacter cryotolerans TaxID=2571270 RepID=A0A4U1C948_9SPHI|nr:chondroitinase-B domain-containing protein [Pedobacter cryotolerans]TKC02318.1 hypothetical protein FA045_03275 [Pedobacter cryotolerans]
MKKLFIFFLLINSYQLASAAKYKVNSADELKNLMPNLLPGDEVIIANGKYINWAVEITCNGTKAKPIVFKAENVGSVIFYGETHRTIFKITGHYITLSGLVFNQCILTKKEGKTAVLIEMSNTKNCIITKCVFKQNNSKIQYSPLVIIAGNGFKNKVDQCLFEQNIDVQDIQVKITKESAPQFSTISYNIFKNKPKVTWQNGNGGECVQIGQDPILLGNMEANTLVSHNKFYNCDGENEIISNKSSKNTYLSNYFTECDGELVMRGGHDCIIKGNIFNSGTGGIRINGTGHIISNNKIKNIKTAIRLMYGMTKGKNETGFYVAASDCIISNNKITNAQNGILVGDNKNEDWTGKFDTKRYPSPVMQNVAPFNNKLNGNVFKNVKATEVIQ